MATTLYMYKSMDKSHLEIMMKGAPFVDKLSTKRILSSVISRLLKHVRDFYILKSSFFITQRYRMFCEYPSFSSAEIRRVGCTLSE